MSLTISSGRGVARMGLDLTFSTSFDLWDFLHPTGDGLWLWFLLGWRCAWTLRSTVCRLGGLLQVTPPFERDLLLAQCFIRAEDFSAGFGTVEWCKYLDLIQSCSNISRSRFSFLSMFQDCLLPARHCNVTAAL